MTIGGGIGLIVSFFLHEAVGQSLWAETTREPVILTALAVIAIALACATLLRNHVVLVAAQFALGFYVFGQTFFVGNDSYSGLQIGFWLAAIASGMMAVGGSLSLAALRSTA